SDVGRVVLCVADLAVLIGGAEPIVRSGTALAAHLGVSPLRIDLTIVAIGMCGPALAVGLDAAVRGKRGDGTDTCTFMAFQSWTVDRSRFRSFAAAVGYPAQQASVALDICLQSCPLSNRPMS